MYFIRNFKLKTVSNLRNCLGHAQYQENNLKEKQTTVTLHSWNSLKTIKLRAYV
jgi:hypothetical protein